MKLPSYYQPLEIFVASAKVKGGLLLRPLTNFFGANGLLQLFILDKPPFSM